MNKQLMKIRCLTNLHVGSGDVNFGIIDGQVERDPVTGRPVIFASGVKGALREYAEQNMNDDDDAAVENIFGVDRNENEKRLGKAGSVKFLTAQMLAMPMRASKGPRSYYMVTTKDMLMQFCQTQCDIQNKNLNLTKDIEKLDSDKNYYLSEKEMQIGVEGYDAEVMIPKELERLKEFLKKTFSDEETVVILSERHWKKVNLPVVARNHLENGKSKNLWYEEIVPHKSIFFMYMLSNGTSMGDDGLDKLLYTIKENPLIQFGGNMTIGNGLTIVERWDWCE